jgi:hypothetical protein
LLLLVYLYMYMNLLALQHDYFDLNSYLHFDKKKKECVEFRQKVARMLTMRELRIKTMEFGNEVRMMES